MTLTSEKKTFRILRESEILADLADVEILDLASHAHHQRFKSKEVIFNENETGSEIYWVTDGRVKLTVPNIAGGELHHGMIEVGDYFGEITMVDEGVRGVSATAAAPTATVTLARSIVLPALVRNPDAAITLARLLCRQVRTAGKTLQSLAFHSSETRIWTRLMDLARRYSTVDPENGSLRISHGLSQQNLADSVGLTRVMVNRQLRLWRDQGLIEDGRGYILIHEPEAFESIVWRRLDRDQSAAKDGRRVAGSFDAS